MTPLDSVARFRLRSDRDDPRLLKALGWLAGVFALLAATIGAGIVSVPQRAALFFSSVPLILSLWAVIGVVCLIGGLIWAELGSRMPYSGGDYQYLTRAYGPGIGFLYGWKSALLSGPQSRAALAIVAADYLGAIVPMGRESHLLAALSAVALAAGVNYVGVVWASRFQGFAAVVKVAGLLALVVAGLLLAAPVDSISAETLTAADTTAPAGGIPVALLLIFFSYTGWARLGYVTGEMRNPRRDLPRVIGLGMGGTLIIYLAINWLCFRTLGLEGVRSSTAVITELAASLLGDNGAGLVAGLIVISVTGAMSVQALAHSRLYLSMAKDGLFFRYFDSVHPVFHTPHRAILFNGAISMLAVVLIRDFTALVTSAIFLNAIFFILRAHTLFRLRKQGVGEEGCYKVPFYPWLPLVFLTSLYGVCLARLVLDWQRAWIDVVLLLIGIPVFLLWRRLSRA